jgi:hypothetical protein
VTEVDAGTQGVPAIVSLVLAAEVVTPPMNVPIAAVVEMRRRGRRRATVDLAGR